GFQIAPGQAVSGQSGIAKSVAGGDPWISIQLSSNGSPLTDRILLGRCVQGFKAHWNHDVSLYDSASALVQAVTCSTRVSSLNVGTNRRHGGLDATLFLDNNQNKVVHELPVQGTL